MRRITAHIPNFITCLNLLCGTVAVVLVFRGQMTQGFWLMVAAAVFDFLDGTAARLLGAYSAIGKELDSLADSISFGLVPATMLHTVYLPAAPYRWMAFIPFIVVIFSALRLAKFNVDTRQTESFLGLPTPANALLTGSMVLYSENSEAWGAMMHSSWLIPSLSVVLSVLLVSELPMFSLKIKHLSFRGENAVRFLFLGLSLVIAAAVLITGLHWSLSVLSVMCLYLIMSGIYSIARRPTTS
ncbi:MAG: CDP-diacylglycerol--serine O-phosphatidyltransferase [Bacteroidales bacterium]|nr:CDP-diacylglycerol--serine O-phosphatidyltransferase [Bacteroidales bacterium]